MIVVVDANVIVGDPHLKSLPWSQLSEAAKARRVRVVAPEIAIREAITRRKKHLVSVGDKIKAASRLAPAEAKELASQARAACVRSGEEYEAKLRKSWELYGFELVGAPNISHTEVARRAMLRILPFDQNGNGYRDTLHWFTVLELAKQYPTEKITLVTNDGIFATKNGSLAPHLVDEFDGHSDADITLCKSLGAIDVPGHYVTDPVDAPEFEDSLRTRILQMLSGEDALRDIRTTGISVPDADWISLVKVSDLAFNYIRARNVERQSEPELRFRATAKFKVNASYVLDDGEDLELAHQPVDIEVGLDGTVATLGNNKVGTILDLEAYRRGFDPERMIKSIRAATVGLDVSAVRSFLASHMDDNAIFSLGEQREDDERVSQGGTE